MRTCASNSTAMLIGLMVTLTPTHSNGQSATIDAGAVHLANGFDHIGAEVHSVEIDGRTSYFIDDGPADGRPVIFIGGQGTSLAAFQLTEFTRSTRHALGLRMISVERNGFGESPLTRIVAIPSTRKRF